MERNYKLFLDDLRNVNQVFQDLTNSDFVIVRSYKAFVSCIQRNGLPYFISFDNDLGESEAGIILKDGYACAKWLVYNSKLDLTELEFHIHSANPVAKKQIAGLLSNYISHLRKDKK